MKFLYLLKQLFIYFKNKLRMNVFNLLDAVHEQYAQWYYFDINIKTIDGLNEYQLPILCCMREVSHANSLMNQIQIDLIKNNNFILETSEITPITQQQKDARIQQLNTQFANQSEPNLKIDVYDVVVKEHRKFLEDLILNDENRNVGNFEINTTYTHEKRIDFKLNVLQNQGVPFSQIKDLFVLKIDKSKLE